MGKQVIFRLIGITPNSWSIKDGTAMKDGTLKNTHYRPGVSSIFDEDNEKSAVQPQWVTFTYNNNDKDPATEIIVPEENKLLIDFLKSLYYFGKVYKIHDAKSNAELKAATFDKISEALNIVDESDDSKLRAMAVAILGFNYFQMDTSFIKADLKEKAVKEASKIIKAFNASDYQSRYLASLAYVKGIIKNNETNTSVIWSNGGGQIIGVAVGDNPIDKMTELMSSGTPQAETLLQELGVRIEKTKTDNSDKQFEANAGLKEVLTAKDALLYEKDKMIAELQEKLAAKESFTSSTSSDDSNDNLGSYVNSNSNVPTLEKLQEEYVKLSGGNLPPNKKNDAGWLSAKVEEFKAKQ